MLKNFILLFCLFTLFACKQQKERQISRSTPTTSDTNNIRHAQGFQIEKSGKDITLIKISSPWPSANTAFTYALIPKEKMAMMTLNKDEYDAIIAVPVDRMVVSSTTHIPALESLDVLDKLVGFPDTKYVSSVKARKRIDIGEIVELGNTENLNTELVISINPEVVVGFAVNGENKALKTVQRSNIPVVYNGDWTEQTPLGKAEWIKFFAPFFQKEKEGNRIFNEIESAYNEAKALASKASNRPSVMSGALYKDVWYLPGGGSWAAQFIKDANANYFWANSIETGSLSLSWESVLETAQEADFWIAPSQFTSYKDMALSSEHYAQFDAYKSKKIYTFSKTKGETGGVLYYELAPQRPDLVLRDLIHIFHPELIPKHQNYFFKSLD